MEVRGLSKLSPLSAIEARIRTGRPLTSPEWIAAAEAAIERKLGRNGAGQNRGEGRILISIVSPKFQNLVSPKFDNCPQALEF